MALSLCADYTTLERDREFRRGELEFIIKYSIVISRQLGDAYPAGMILNRYSLPPPFPLSPSQALLHPHSPSVSRHLCRCDEGYRDTIDSLEAIPSRARLVRVCPRSLGSLIIPFGTSCWSLILTNNRGGAQTHAQCAIYHGLEWRRFEWMKVGKKGVGWMEKLF